MTITVSTVTPVYAGEKYLVDLVEKIAELRQQWASSNSPLVLAETILVDDGSIDSSAQIIAGLSDKYPWVSTITMSRNFGQHSATVAGICHSSSDWVVTLDEDLQHIPADIETLFQAQSTSRADVVYATPIEASHGNSWRDNSSKLVKKILAGISKTPQIRMFNSFRLVRGSIARAAASSSSSQTYLDVAISWFTKRAVTAQLKLVDDRYIAGNQSGYNFGRLISHARRLMVSSSFDIASKVMLVGVITILFSAAIGITALTIKLTAPDSIQLIGWTSLISVISLLGGVIILLLCIILEYVGILVSNQLGKPTYFTCDRSSDRLLRKWYKNKDS